MVKHLALPDSGAKLQAWSDFESFGDSCLFVLSSWVIFVPKLVNTQQKIEILDHFCNS